MTFTEVHKEELRSTLDFLERKMTSKARPEHPKVSMLAKSVLRLDRGAGPNAVLEHITGCPFCATAVRVIVDYTGRLAAHAFMLKGLGVPATMLDAVTLNEN